MQHDGAHDINCIEEFSVTIVLFQWFWTKNRPRDRWISGSSEVLKLKPTTKSVIPTSPMSHPASPFQKKLVEVELLMMMLLLFSFGSKVHIPSHRHQYEVAEYHQRCTNSHLLKVAFLSSGHCWKKTCKHHVATIDPHTANRYIYIYVYIPGTQKTTVLIGKRPSFEGLKPQNRGQTGCNTYI